MSMLPSHVPKDEATPTIPPSLDLAFEEAKRLIAAQDAQLAALDGKANFGLGSATLLTAGVAALRSSMNNVEEAAQVSGQPNMLTVRSFEVDWLTVANGLTIAALGVYAWVVLSALSAYGLRKYENAPDPQKLLARFLNKPEHETKRKIVEELADAFATNAEHAAAKVKWTRRVIWGLLAEAVVLVGIAAVQFAL